MTNIIQEDRAARFIQEEFGKDFVDEDLAILLAKYLEWKEPVVYDIEHIKLYIKWNKLDKKNRERKVLFTRKYLCAYIRIKSEDKMSYAKIGELFGQDHATVLHSIRHHHEWVEQGDKLYAELTRDVAEKFPLGLFVRTDKIEVKLNQKEQEIIRINRSLSNLNSNHESVKNIINKYGMML